MLENPTANPTVLGYSCAKVRFKQHCLSNHSELITGTYELSSLTTTNTITSNNIELPLKHIVYMSTDQKKIYYQQFLWFTSLPYSHFRCCILSGLTQRNIPFLISWITFNYPNISIMSVSNKSIKVKVKFYMYKPRRHTE
jgi:hypothetical protein